MEGRQLISHGTVYVNGKVNTKPGTRILSSDIISFGVETRSILEKNLLFRIKIKNLRSLKSSALDICYKHYRIIFLGSERCLDLSFPFKFESNKLFNVYNYR
jgi:ribosomal protein S4